MYDRTVIGPYADKPIELSLLSVSGKRYRTYYCIECNHPFLQRDNDDLYRLNTNDEPSRTYMNNGFALARCAVCSQKYTVTISFGMVAVDNIQHELQSMYIVPVEQKVSRYVRCLECGYTFCSMTDRISKIVDSVMPLEYVPANRVAYMESRCDQNRCRQRWAIIV